MSKPSDLDGNAKNLNEKSLFNVIPFYSVLVG